MSMRLLRREKGWLFGGLCSVALCAALVAMGFYRQALERTELELAALSREHEVRTVADGMEIELAVAERDRALGTVKTQERAVIQQRQRIEHLTDEGERLRAERDTIVEQTAAEQARLLIEQEAALEESAAERERLAEERDRAFVERDATMNETRWILRELDAQTRSAVADVEKIILATGLEPARIVPEPNRLRRVGARGGPYIPWKAQVAHADLVEANQVRAVARQLDKLKALRDVMVRLPLIAPVTHAILSDGFGYRFDPVHGGGARHDGLDLRAVRDSAVIAPAAGTVIAAGWDGAFGNLIQIDHGFGVVSRYAHLSRMLVRKGDVVAPREQIGVVGATGRVTGAHLHYEIWIDGQPRDPMRFIKAISQPFAGFTPQ